MDTFAHNAVFNFQCDLVHWRYKQHEWLINENIKMTLQDKFYKDSPFYVSIK